MNSFYMALEKWESYFPKGCRVVVYSDGSGHVEAKKTARSNKFHSVFAFDAMWEFCGSEPNDFYPQNKPSRK